MNVLLAVVLAASLASPRLGDNLWMWGHDTGHYDGPVNYARHDYKIPASMPIAMADACVEMGIPQCCVIRPDMPPPDAYLVQFEKLKGISWLLWRSTREYCLEKAVKIPNLKAFDFDDFFSLKVMIDVKPDGTRVPVRKGVMTLLEIDETRRLLSARAGHPVEFRMVLYVSQLDPFIIPACEAMDKILLWTWDGTDVLSMEANVRRFRQLVPDKPIVLGLYMWDFGGHRPIAREFMRSQLDLAERLYKEGVVEGLIFHCTPLVNKNLEAVEMAKAWIAAHRNDVYASKTPTAEACGATSADARPPFPMQDLSFDVPKTWPCGALSKDDLRAIWLEGEPCCGKPTRVFAYLALPEGACADKKVPGIVLAHGGGGTAYPDWARTWAKKGYAAIVVDTCGHLPLQTPDAAWNEWLPSGAGGPAGWGRYDLGLENPSDQWPYQAVGALVRAHSLLRSLSEVDAEKTGITGISWGGFLTMLAAATDKRFKFAMPVYACGFYSEMDELCGFHRKGRSEAGADAVLAWDALWDPKHYAPRIDLPTFWFASSNDPAFPFETLQKTVRLPKILPSLAVRVKMVHAHGPAGENMPELFRFADHVVMGAPALPSVGMPDVRNGVVSVPFDAKGNRLARFELNWCADAVQTAQSDWRVERQAVPADGVLRFSVPAGAKRLYVNAVLEGETGEPTYPEAVVSSPAVSLP